MSTKWLLFVLVFAVSFSKMLSYEEDEYYCKNTNEYKICNRCKSLEQDCELPPKDRPCKCDNIAVFNEESGL